MNPQVEQETALIWTGGGRRFFTRKAAERAAVKSVIRDFNRATGDDSIESDVYAELVRYLVEMLRGGKYINVSDVDEYFNPHHYPDKTGSEAQAEHREDQPILPNPIEGRGP